MNPFVGYQLFVGRERERTRLVTNCRQGISSLVIGGRRSGKTALLRQLAEADIVRQLIPCDAGQWELHGEEHAVHSIGLAFGKTCRTRDDLETLLRAHAPFCLAIDEADRILREPWSGGFLAWLRWLIGPNGLHTEAVVVLAGGPTLLGYEHPGEKGSPVLNISERVFLRPLHTDDVAKMTEHCDALVDEDWLLRHAGGHPWLLQKVLREIHDGEETDAALREARDQVHDSFPVWRRQLGQDGVAFLRQLPAEGVTPSALENDPTWRPHTDGFRIARYLCLVRRATVNGQSRWVPGPRLFLDWLADQRGVEAWDLAISYASEDTETARSVKAGLVPEFRVFFAPDECAWLWGEPLSTALPSIYGENTRYALVLSSEAYVNKHWTMVEFQAARARMRRLLVVNLGRLPDDLPSDVVYKGGQAAELVSLVDDLRDILRQEPDAAARQ